jgi:CubicO group peptidase (beta-lactamase class C family)
MRPTLVRPETMVIATTVAFPGLVGVLPGVGRFDPLDWGLGFELRDAKVPHWTGSANSPGTFGHFGGAGTFVWVDPAVDVATVVLTDREYGPWALDAWPKLSDAVLRATAGGQAGLASP